MSEEEKEERRGKYWICMACAAEKELEPPIHPVTIIIGLCGWCNHDKKEPLTPLVDFSEDYFD